MLRLSVAALPLFIMFRRRLREREVAMQLWPRVPLPLLVEIALAVLTVIASQAKRRRPGR
jgi:heme A synthase